MGTRGHGRVAGTPGMRRGSKSAARERSHPMGRQWRGSAKQAPTGRIGRHHGNRNRQNRSRSAQTYEVKAFLEEDTVWIPSGPSREQATRFEQRRPSHPVESHSRGRQRSRPTARPGPLGRRPRQLRFPKRSGRMGAAAGVAGRSASNRNGQRQIEIGLDGRIRDKLGS